MTRCASRKEVWASETPVCTLWQPSWPQAAALWAEYNDTHDPDVATTETQFSSAPSTKTPRSTQAVRAAARAVRPSICPTCVMLTH